MSARSEESFSSLPLAVDIIEHIGVDKISQKELLELFKSFEALYSNKKRSGYRGDVIGSRYFIDRFVKCISLEDTIYLLDNLAPAINCVCKKKRHECFCRNGKSKILGRLINRYFEEKEDGHNPQQIWGWFKNFFVNGGYKDSGKTPSVLALSKKHKLRRDMFKHAFFSCKNIDEIRELKFSSVNSYGHDAIKMYEGDELFLLDAAFTNKNLDLWKYLYPFAFSSEKEVNPLRRLARFHANHDPDFMMIWSTKNYERKKYLSEHGVNYGYKMSRRYRRRKRKKAKKLAEDRQYFKDNEALIAEGKDFHNFALESADNS